MNAMSENTEGLNKEHSENERPEKVGSEKVGSEKVGSEKESVPDKSAAAESTQKEITPKEGVKVSIMQREFTIACSKDENQSVVEAAAYLDKQMRTVTKGAQVLGVDRCAIMAGLNISHELLELRKSVGDDEQITSRLQCLHEQIDKAVTNIQRPAS